MSERRPVDLQVRVSGALVGRLERDREGRCWFRPDPAWLEGGQRPALGLAFLARPDARMAGTGLPSWFENLLPPAGSALRATICAERGLRGTDSAALIRALGRDLPGAVEVVGEADEVEAGRVDGPLRVTFSLAGMQLKFSMVEAKQRFALPARGQEGAWIVKLPGEEFPGLPEVELATMAWAEAAGLPVPERRLVPTAAIDGLSEALRARSPTAFAIRRFDRAPGFRRVHQEDFAQALEIDPEHLYGNTGPRRTSYDRLAALVLDAAGPEAQGAFVDRLAFVIASGNGDAHLKNWSFQWIDAPRPRLSPVYDQVSTITWPHFGWAQAGGPELGLGFGKTRRFAQLDHRRLDLFCARGRVVGGPERFKEGLKRALAAWEALGADAPEAMRAAVSHHLHAVPLLRTL